MFINIDDEVKEELCVFKRKLFKVVVFLIDSFTPHFEDSDINIAYEGRYEEIILIMVRDFNVGTDFDSEVS